MQINTSSLATLKAFNEFAAPSVKKGTIARLDAARPLGEAVRVVRGAGDKAYALFRNTESKTNNDSVRAAFRNAVGNLFGGEDKIPESVNTNEDAKSPVGPWRVPSRRRWTKSRAGS